MADTINIAGREIPLADVVAAYTKLPQHEQELATLRTAQAAANQEIASASPMVEMVQRMQSEPGFAKQVVDRLSGMHSQSAYFQASTEPPAAAAPAAPAPGAAPVTTPAPAAGTQIPVPGAMAAPDLESAKQVEDLRREFNAFRNQQALDGTLLALGEQFPGLDTEALLKAAIERGIPLENLDLLADRFERERLQGVLAEKSKNNDLINDLLAGGGGKTDDENLANLGLSVSAAQLQGDSAVDYASLSTADALALAFAEQGMTAGTV